MLSEWSFQMLIGAPIARFATVITIGRPRPEALYRASAMEALEMTCPLEDRVPERKVFQGLNYSAARQAMSRACLLAKIPNYTPHDLRHRRITLWHQSGVPARELAERAGHSKPSMSLDVYTHVMPVAEVDDSRLALMLS